MRLACAIILFLSTACSSARFSLGSDPQAGGAPAADPARASAARSIQDEFVEVARKAAPSIVTVRAYVKNGTGPARAATPDAAGWGGSQPNQDYFGYELLSAASGFVTTATGDVLTCAHYLQRADGTPADLVDIETHDGARILVEIVGTEPTVNLAILRCVVFPNGHAGQLVPLRFGDSDVLECGQWTFGVGDPAGPEKFFAAGTFITKPSRECYQDYLSAFYLQTAMVVHPGAYGGPLLDLDGDVVGILAPRDPRPGASGMEPRFGLELALPSKIVQGLYDAIGKARSSQSPWLGFSVMSRAEIATVRGVDAFNALPKPKNGILIENVYTPSPATEAGIQAGDFLVGFDTYKVFTPVDFQRYLYLAGVGKQVELEIYRDGATLKKSITILRRPPEAVPR